MLDKCYLRVKDVAPLIHAAFATLAEEHAAKDEATLAERIRALTWETPEELPEGLRWTARQAAYKMREAAARLAESDPVPVQETGEAIIMRKALEEIASGKYSIGRAEKVARAALADHAPPAEQPAAGAAEGERLWRQYREACDSIASYAEDVARLTAALAQAREEAKLAVEVAEAVIEREDAELQLRPGQVISSDALNRQSESIVRKMEAIAAFRAARDAG